jgi:carbohydrate diacid regulator
MFLPELAEKIVREVKKLIDEDIIVVDTNGTIIASTDQKRVGNYHEGAQIAAARREKLIITEEDETKLSGVRMGINLPVFFRREVIGVIGITGAPEKISRFGEIIRKMTELLVSENYYSDQLELQSRSLEALVFEWIQNRAWDTAFLHRAQLLNIDLEKKRQAVMIEFHWYEHLNHRDIYTSFSKWNVHQKNDILVRWGNHRILMLREVNERETHEHMKQKILSFQSYLEEQLHIPMSIGVGQKVTPQDVSLSFKQAERAIKTAKQQSKIVFDEDLTIEMILDEVRPETKRIFIERTISPLLEDKDLLLTLQKWFENNLSLKKTAAALHVHINTLHYRLKKVQELTNLNPNEVRDLLNLYLSLQIIDETTKNEL